MKKSVQIFCYVILLVLVFSCSSDDDCDKIDCPEINNSYPLLLGNWNFTGTIINGELLLEECDLFTTLEIGCGELKFTSFFGDNCSESSTSIVDFIIDNNNIVYLDESGNESFAQEIMTLNTTTLILKTIGTGNNTVTENWTRQ